MPFIVVTIGLTRREAFPSTLRILNNIVQHMHRGGTPTEWDLNNVLLRFAMDMTSIVVSASIAVELIGKISYEQPQTNCSCVLPT